MVVIRRLRWNTWNIAHIARHDVTPKECVEVCLSDAVERMGERGRIILIGPTIAGRILKVVLAPEPGGVYYPITAHVASRQERRIYSLVKGGEAA